MIDWIMYPLRSTVAWWWVFYNHPKKRSWFHTYKLTLKMFSLPKTIKERTPPAI